MFLRSYILYNSLDFNNLVIFINLVVNKLIIIAKFLDDFHFRFDDIPL